LETKISNKKEDYGLYFENIKCKVGDVNSEGKISRVNKNQKTHGNFVIKAWGSETTIDLGLLDNDEILEASFEGKNFDMAKVPFLRYEKIKSGIGAFNGKIKTKIKDSKEAKAHLNGHTSFQVNGVKIETVDLAAITQAFKNAKGIEDIGNVLNATQKQSENNIESAEGKIEWDNGFGKVTSFTAKTSEALVRGSGTLDLKTEQLNLSASLEIPQIKLSGIGVKIVGPFSGPSFQLDENAIRKILINMVTKKVEGEIKKHVGKALGETFGKILGEGKAKESANENKINPEKIIKGLFGR
jgi:hypothetical protein